MIKMRDKEDKFEEWLDKEIKQLEKQTKLRYCCGWGCLFEILSKTGLSLKLTYLKEIKEKYIEIRNGEEGK